MITPNPPIWAFANLAGSLRNLGREAEADSALEELFRRAPALSIERILPMTENYEPESRKRWIQLLRDAGIPEV